MISHKIYSIPVLLLFTLLCAACVLPVSPSKNPTPTGISSDAIYTQAVETVMAQLTQAAPTQINPPSNQATSTPVPPSPSPVVTQTEAPTLIPATATPTQAAPTQALTPSATLPSTDPRAPLGNPIWHDTFDGARNWYIYEDDRVKFKVENGKLIMTAKKSNGEDGWALTGIPANNMYLEMTATFGACSGLDRYGLMVRAPADTDGGYLFALSCDGHYSFWKWNGTKRTILVDWTTSSSILAGTGQTNRISIKVEGYHFYLYANGILLKDLQDSTYKSHYFGIFIGAVKTANFTTTASELDYWEIP